MPDIRPLVTVILPCRNEEKFIAGCLDSITSSDYPKDRLEVLVVDGMSEDGTTGNPGQIYRPLSIYKDG